MDVKNINLLELVGILGAIVMIVGVFLVWGTAEISTVLGSGTMEWSGWDIYNHVDNVSTDYDYAPLVALICGILALIAAIIPMFLSSDDYGNIFKIMNLAVLVIGLVALVCMVLFYNNFVDSFSTVGLTGTVTVGTGFWLCIIGGVITVIGGIIPIINKLIR